MFKRKNLSDNLPKHIGIIMDGNGRWAQRRGLPRNMGHKEGVNAIDRTIDALIKFNIKIVTFFAFSTENWKRSQQEIDGIFDLVRNYLKEQKDRFLLKGVKVISIGDISKFPKDLVEELEDVQTKTKNNDKLILNLAINYGGRDDIARAVNTLIKSGKTFVTTEDISKHLYTCDLPDPDFVIRTSGEERISNFMIYQMAYSELYFPKVMWPDFGEKDLFKALKVYSKRERRYGGIK